MTRLSFEAHELLAHRLFWISIFTNNKAELLLAQGKVAVSDKPVESRVGIGILADRPVAEPLQEIPHIEIES